MLEEGIAGRDDDEVTTGISKTLEKGSSRISISVKELFEAGIQINHVRGVALWCRDKPRRVTIRQARLVGNGVDLATGVRRGEKLLMQDERRDANFFWSYHHWAKLAAVSDEHPSTGKQSYKLNFRKGIVSAWARFAHDWRGYDKLAFDVYNPRKKPVTVTVNVKDTWIKFFSKAFIAKKAFTLAPEKMTTVEFPLADLREEKRNKPLNPAYIQQIYFEVAQDSRQAILFMDNFRLIGKGGPAPAGSLGAKNIPAFGFENAAENLKLPVDLGKLPIPTPRGGFAKLQGGAARINVTPDVGTRMASAASKCEGILDDVYVRALILKPDGGDTIAWLHFDNIYIPGRKEVPPVLAAKLGIKEANIFWSATHNHNCGAPWSSKKFNQKVIDGFVRAAEKAAKSMQPVKVGFASTHARFNYNRVMRGPDGNHYGMLDSKFMGHLMDSRPTETELATIWFVGPDDKPVAGVVCYTGHANMLCRVLPWISGDWSGWTQRLLEKSSGAVVMHINGALGDVDMRGNSISIDRTIAAGWDVAHASMRSSQTTLIGVNAASYSGVKVFSGSGIGSPLKEGDKSRQLTVKVLTIGPVALVDVGGELWSRFGLEIKRRSPFPHTFVNYSSGYYYPEEWAFEKKSYGTKNRKSDWGGVVRDTAVKILKEAAAKAN